MARTFERPTNRDAAEAPTVVSSASVQPAQLAQSSTPAPSSATVRHLNRGALTTRVVSIVFVLSITLVAVMALTSQPHVALADIEDENLVDPTQRADNSFIHDTTISTLFEQGSLYNDHEVQVYGEVIGDCIADNKDGFSWITLTVLEAEDKTSISVLISDEQAGQIDHYGRYGVTGTTLQVLGVFHQSCSEHDGLTDIHCTDSSVLERGAEHPDAFNVGDFIPGIVTIAVGLVLLVAFYAARERMR